MRGLQLVLLCIEGVMLGARKPRADRNEELNGYGELVESADGNGRDEQAPRRVSIAQLVK